MRHTTIFSVSAITVLIMIGGLSSLVVAEIFLRFVPVYDKNVAIEAVNGNNPILKFTPNTDFTYSSGWNLAHSNTGWINNDGFVNDQDYDPTDTRSLLAVVGDCFIEAWPVPTRETAHGRLAAKAGTAGRVYSFATSDAPLSQYLIWAEYAAHKYKADGLVITIDDDDFAESLLKYQNLPGRHYFTETPDGQLELHRIDSTPASAPDPLRSIVKQSALARYLYYNLDIANFMSTLQRRSEASSVSGPSTAFDSQRLADSEKVISTFLEELPERTSLAPDRILLVVEGIRSKLYEDRNSERDSYFCLVRKRLLKEAQNRGYETIDLHPVFAERYRQDKQLLHLPDDRHWNSAGHAVVADAIMQSKLFSKIFTMHSGAAMPRIGASQASVVPPI